MIICFILFGKRMNQEIKLFIISFYFSLPTIKFRLVNLVSRIIKTENCLLFFPNFFGGSHLLTLKPKLHLFDTNLKKTLEPITWYDLEKSSTPRLCFIWLFIPYPPRKKRDSFPLFKPHISFYHFRGNVDTVLLFFHNE